MQATKHSRIVSSFVSTKNYTVCLRKLLNFELASSPCSASSDEIVSDRIIAVLQNASKDRLWHE